MKNKSLRPFRHGILSLLLLAISSTSSEPLKAQSHDLGANYAEFLPDGIAFLVHIKDLTRLEENTKEGPLGDLIENENLKDFLRPLLNEMDSDNFLEITSTGDDNLFWQYFRNWVTGSLSVAVTAPEDIDGDAEFVLIADFTGNRDDLDSLMEFFSDEANPPEDMEVYAFDEEFMGVNLRIEEVFDADGDLVRRNGWALVDSITVIAHPDNVLRDTVARLLEPRSLPSLVDQRDFTEAQFTTGETDVLAFMHVGTLLSLFEKGFFLGYNESMGEEDGAGAMGFFSPQAMFDAMQLDQLRAFFLGATMEPDQIQYRTGLTYNQREGIARLFAYEQAPFDRIGIAPPNALSASVYNYRFGEAWDFLMETFEAASPFFAGMVQQQLDQFSGDAGVDFQEDLFRNFEGEVQTFSILRTSASVQPGDPENDMIESDAVFALRLADSARFELALETLLQQTGLSGFLENSEAGDHLVRLVKMPLDEEAGDFLSFSISPTYLFLGMGKPEILQEVFQRLDQQSNDIWSRADLQRALGLLPQSDVSRSFIDLEAVIDTWLDMMIFFNSNMPPDSQFIDPAFRPEGSTFPYFHIAVALLQDRGIYFEGLILPKDLLDE